MKRSAFIPIAVVVTLIMVAQLVSVYIQPSAIVQAFETAAIESNTKNVSLAGKWEFYWQRLLEPRDFQTSARPARDYIDVPGSWRGQTLGPQTNGGAPLPRFGYATYRLVMNIPQAHVGQNQALFFRYIDSAYNIWIDGKRMNGLGKVATSRADEEPNLRMRMFYFTPQQRDVEIIIQVSNFSFREAGIVGEAKYGQANMLTAEVFRQIAIQDLMFISFFLLLSVYHLIIFFTRRTDYSALWLGILTALIALRTLLISEYLAYITFPWLPWEHVIRIEYIAESLLMVCYTLLFHTLYAKDAHKSILYFTSIYSALLIVYFLVTDTAQFTSTLSYHWLIYLLVFSYYAFYLGVVTTLRKRPGAYLNMIGIVVILIGTINDLFYYTGMITSIPIVSISLLIYFLLQAMIIAYRYSRLFDQNRRLASELQSVNLVLEEKVAERTEELRAMNTELVKSNRQQMQLMENIAHDLGSPIVGAQTHVSLLKQGVIRQEQQARVYNILQSNLAYMKRLVQDLFDLTGFERKQALIQLQPLSIGELWQQIQTVLQEKVEWQQITLQYGRLGQEADRKVSVDPLGIARVVQNFLDNAIKFSDEESCPIFVEWFVREHEVVFEMRDQGRGISEAELPHIFERFYKGVEYSKGVGLGLAIVKEIVEQHDGCVIVRSQLGQGSTFGFSLPLLNE
jgi:signal transduction histidine kinase